ncbi:MAG: acyl-CoA thioesterase [Halanaeroarchaeum sp.]
MTELQYETEIPVRYADHDTLGHVNNAVYATYLEEGRISYFQEVLDESLTDRSMVVANLEMDFLAPVTTEHVVVGVGVVGVGTRSFTLEYGIDAGGTTAATASTVQVHIDPETGDPEPLPEDWQHAFERDVQ